MMIKYWEEQLSEDTILDETVETVTAFMEMNVVPELCFKSVRDTMEVFGYRTAMTYTDEGAPSLFYYTTLKGINCHEASPRSNGVDELPLSCQES